MPTPSHWQEELLTPDWGQMDGGCHNDHHRRYLLKNILNISARNRLL